MKKIYWIILESLNLTENRDAKFVTIPSILFSKSGSVYSNGVHKTVFFKESHIRLALFQVNYRIWAVYTPSGSLPCGVIVI